MFKMIINIIRFKSVISYRFLSVPSVMCSLFLMPFFGLIKFLLSILPFFLLLATAFSISLWLWLLEFLGCSLPYYSLLSDYATYCINKNLPFLAFQTLFYCFHVFYSYPLTPHVTIILVLIDNYFFQEI